MIISPYRIDVAEAEMADLHRRLDATRWSAPAGEAGWSRGTDQIFLKGLASYWRHQFDWRAAEARLNANPQFLADLGDQQVHFVRMISPEPNAVPIVLTHGWPSTFAELLVLGKMLAHPRAYGALAKDAFDVVIPSLPGFAFSSASPKLGRGVFETADVWVKLMSHLGYSRFIAQGGDLGAGVSTAIGLKYPDAALGLHLNFIPGSYRPPATSQELDEEENEFLRRRAAWLDLEGAYSHLQATKPESLAPALNDSPVGLLAWITEKFRSWSDCNGELETRISKDELLTTASLYWFSRSMPAAIRVYWEVRQSPLQFRAGDRITVPVGVAEFPRELPMPPRRYVERGFNVVQWTKMPSGGHFAPIEEPAALAEDIRRFASRFRT